MLSFPIYSPSSLSLALSLSLSLSLSCSLSLSLYIYLYIHISFCYSLSFNIHTYFRYSDLAISAVVQVAQQHAHEVGGAAAPRFNVDVVKRVYGTLCILRLRVADNNCSMMLCI